MEIVFLGKKYQSLRECYDDNRDIAEVSLSTFGSRIRKGMPFEAALTTPKNQTPTVLGSHIVEGVEYPNLPSIARAYGLKEMAVYKRHNRGYRGDDLVALKKRKNYVPPEPEKPVQQVEIGGVIYKNLTAAFKALGVKKHTFYNRIVRNYPFEQCIGLEPFADRRRTRARTYEYQGEQLTLKDIADRYNLHPKTFLRRLQRGSSIEEALTKTSHLKQKPDGSYFKYHSKKE